MADASAAVAESLGEDLMIPGDRHPFKHVLLGVREGRFGPVECDLVAACILYQIS
jgi:hypothetical protein